eukprot:CAMPEP_0117432648 /NCGR_PEP_ID=MMETSP0758-20121206/12091_1 /TAXON_ID=63605 /ORGANISM="Percolomonas cosmopolitus, Strain AE-1 (ATCC 50343)" /LENGTH=69 /DNA_ID=CAMNT_0005222685 /DNA_START=1663 /DNA_END=1873 /DNA_ORIENTATION=-
MLTAEKPNVIQDATSSAAFIRTLAVGQERVNITHDEFIGIIGNYGENKVDGDATSNDMEISGASLSSMI